MTRYQPQFDSDSDRSRRIRRYMRDKIFQLIIVILSFIAIGLMAWLTFEGEKVDYKITHWVKP